MNSRCQSLAIIPVYRDHEAIIKVLSRFTERYVDEICLVIDGIAIDDVRNNSLKVKMQTPAGIPVKIFVNPERKGIGFAIKQGIRYGLDHNYQCFVVMAGNNKDDPAEIRKVLYPIKRNGYDYVQGSRFLPGGKRVNNPFLRGVFTRLYPFFWTLFTGKNCTDVTNGFRAYKSELLRNPEINIWQEWLDGYQLEYYLHYKFLTLGYNFTEVPVSKIYSHRHKGGYSQISPLKDWWRIVGPLIYLLLKIKE